MLIEGRRKTGWRGVEAERSRGAEERQQERPAAGTAAETVLEGAAAKPGRLPVVPATPAGVVAGWVHREAEDAARGQ